MGPVRRTRGRWRRSIRPPGSASPGEGATPPTASLPPAASPRLGSPKPGSGLSCCTACNGKDLTPAHRGDMPQRYDLIIVGMGSGGMVASEFASTLDLRVAVIEGAGELGGNHAEIGRAHV